MDPVFDFDMQERVKVRVIPDTQLFPSMLRHSLWTVVRYQSDQRTKQTPLERTRCCRYDSALVPFREIVMTKIEDGHKMRANKLDSLGKPCRQIKYTFAVDDEGLRDASENNNQENHHVYMQPLQWEHSKVVQEGSGKACLQYKRRQRLRQDKIQPSTIPCQTVHAQQLPRNGRRNCEIHDDRTYQ